MRRPVFLLLLLLPAFAVFSAEPPFSATALPTLEKRARLVLPVLDAAKALQEDRLGYKPGEPLRYAISHHVDGVDPDARTKGRSGAWSQAPDGRALWRWAVDAPGALALDFGFERFRLPHGAELWIVGEGKGNHIGPFTDSDNPSAGSALWTPRVTGERAELRLFIPEEKRGFLDLRLAAVNQAYRDVTAPLALEKSGSCNIDVACPEGDDWQNEIHTVAHYTFQDQGSFVCTGQLAATTAPALDPVQPVFLTANHCVDSATAANSMVFYWRYESPTCRAPGSGQSGQPLPRASNTAATQSGATLLATHLPSDFTAVRLNAPVPSAAQAVWSGWDRTGATPSGSVAIHHPQGDEKRISFNFDPLTKGENCIRSTSGSTHWYVDDWEEGTTEQGSSGGGLWDPDSRLLIGVLSGGLASCSRIDYDCFGRLDAAWEGGGTAASRMRDWLDRGGTGAQTLPGGTGQSGCSVLLSSPAFSTAPTAGSLFTVTAAVTDGEGGLTYAWDLDDDDVIDRRGTDPQLQLSYPEATSTQLRVTVTGNGDCSASASAALDVRGPALSATPQAPQQLCGDSDNRIEPGERWRLPVALRNGGDGSFATPGRALFVPQSGGAPIGPDDYGYTAATTSEGGCNYQFVDIASGANAAGPLELADAGIIGSAGAHDDGRNADPVALEPGMRIHGQAVTQAIMSTNGYISFSDAESGGDWSVACPDLPNNDSFAPRLHVLHDDLILNTGGALRHRWFASCPRAADTGPAGGCHVFQWSAASLLDEGGSFDFQALLYPGNDQIVYQYRSAPPDGGDSASIGLISASDDPLVVACENPGAVAAQTAVCIFDKDAQPGSSGALRLETPAPTLATLAAGASATINVDLFVSADASCGAPLAVDFLGAANATQSAPAEVRVLSTTVGAGQACNASSCSAQGPDVDPRHGLFFQHARPGNGLLNFVYDVGSQEVFGGIWYTAQPDRSPQWYTLQGEHVGQLSTATLRRFSNSAAPNGFAPVATDVGSAWIAQPAADSVVQAWAFDDGRRGIELLASVGLPFSSPNRSQQWFPPTQPGWGAAVESNAVPGGGYSEFWAVFLYDQQGDGRWVVGGSGETSGTVALNAFEVHCPGCPFIADALARPRPAGTLSRTWPALDQGLLDTDILLPSPLSGSWLRDNLPIVPVGPVDQP